MDGNSSDAWESIGLSDCDCEYCQRFNQTILAIRRRQMSEIGIIEFLESISDVDKLPPEMRPYVPDVRIAAIIALISLFLQRYPSSNKLISIDSDLMTYKKILTSELKVSDEDMARYLESALLSSMMYKAQIAAGIIKADARRGHDT